MSTRGAFGFVLKGELKLTYNHNDSYPAGLGEEVMAFARHTMKNDLLEVLKERVAKVELVKDKDTVPAAILDTKKSKNLVRRTKNTLGSKPSWYEYLRPFQGAEMLWKISKGEVEYMIDANGFPKDSLFCEYCYIIDFDLGVLDVYVGGQTEPDATNPFGIEPTIPFPEAQPEKVYFPCKLVASFYLSDLPEGPEWQEPIKEYKANKMASKS